MRLHHEKRRDGVRVDHEKKTMGEEFTMSKSDGVRIRHKKERWCES